MKLKHILTYALTLSPKIFAKKAGSIVLRRILAKCNAVLRGHKSSFPLDDLLSELAAPPIGFYGHIDASEASITPMLHTLASRHANHAFNLLGSGWVRLAYGAIYDGFAGYRYYSHLSGNEDQIIARLSPGNRKQASKIRKYLSTGYQAIDWQVDFRSGHRWRENDVSKGIFYGHLPGVDIKLPWELARLQHLPMMALAARSADGKTADKWRRECLDQVLDFISTNPPGYGANWVCTMDVAIRAANMVLTYWLLSTDKNVESRSHKLFERELVYSLTSHGRHIISNLENTDTSYGNHYLADICGLLYVAAALPRNTETSYWWRFACDQLISEISRQFNCDGSNFEGSTSYHRLSSEMAVYGLSLIVGRDGAEKIPAEIASKLAAMAQFSIDISKPNNQIAQIGDNDSGRFFKICPAHFTEDLTENHLDHRATIAAISSLLSIKSGIPDFKDLGCRTECEVVSALTNGQRLLVEAPYHAATTHAIKNKIPSLKGSHPREIKITLSDLDILLGLRPAAYPNFGLFIWKSPRFYMSMRCGVIGQNERGGHAHNDQLSIELNIDGVDWLLDPGSYVYTPSPKTRNAYRSIMAHAAPRQGTLEPASLRLGLFRLENRAQAKCITFNHEQFEGMHVGFGKPVYRAVKIQSGIIHIRDTWGGATNWEESVDSINVVSGEQLRQIFEINTVFSPGYGLLNPT
ncbi:MAG: hypothetical protein CBB68_07000 [Rhodospirillaceae bacterium TMED8]|nr:hypothetical protein [Magnetovibrio sp.]OUT50741.1 MAG: hypothetical protein CBB68_07000 [Rhodospirillaceae bacterium TMED8]